MPRRNSDLSRSIILTRSEKAYKIAFQKGAIKRLDTNTYQVKSQSGNGSYVVVSTPYGKKCSCPDHVYRKLTCKHIIALNYSQHLRREVEETQVQVIQQVSVSGCLFCTSVNVVKDGIRHNKKSGNIQKFHCRTCHKYFTVNLGFEGMRAPAQVITESMQLFFSGESLRSVQKFLKLRGYPVNHMTIYRWIKKYVALMQNYLDKIQPKVSETWRTDELFLKIKGDTKYLYAIMDDETRFMIAQQVSDTKFTHDVRPLFREARDVAGMKPTTLISDGAQNFHQAYLKELRTLGRETQHIQHIHMAGDHNNNKMERLNGEIRDREKTMRGLKKMDTPVLLGYQQYHNYFREHMGLQNKTPAEIAGIKIEGLNKMMTVIQNAALEKKVRKVIYRHVLMRSINPSSPSG
jgi:transposase-like protein